MQAQADALSVMSRSMARESDRKNSQSPNVVGSRVADLTRSVNMRYVLRNSKQILNGSR